MIFDKLPIPTGLLLSAALIIFLLAGCSNPASSDDEEHNEDAVGAVLKMNGEEIVRYEDGQISGSIEVNEGEETPLITIYFLDDEGHEFQPEDSEYSLRWKDIDTTVVEVEQHDEDGRWRFHILGNSQGSTTATFQLYHGSHSDFDLENVTINVN